MTRRRITILAFHFPPIQQVGARRPLRLANYLARQGHDVTVYAVHPRTPWLDSYCRADTSLPTQIDPGVRVVRTPSFHGFKMLLACRDALTRRRGTPPGGNGAEHRSSGTKPRSSLRQALSRFVGPFGTPDPFIGWIFTTLPVVLAQGVRKRPDAIYVTGPPWSPMVLAVLAGRLLRVPVHLDFRDPWTLNPYYYKARSAAVRLERWIVHNSRSIIANTERLAGHFRHAYPDLAERVVAIYNGYDEETRQQLETLERAPSRGASGPFVVSHVGRLYPNRMPRSLARKLAGIARNWRCSRPIRFRFVGSVWDPAPLVEEFQAAGVADALELAGEVCSEKALRDTVGADVLLLLQLGAPEQLPAKIFEYAFAGNPLVSVADEDSETTALFRKYRLGLATDGKEDDEALFRHLAALCEGEVVAAPAGCFARDFDGQRLAGDMADVVLRDARSVTPASASC